MNKSPTVGKATKKRSALPVNAEAARAKLSLSATLRTCPGRQWLGPFPSAGTLNRSLRDGHHIGRGQGLAYRTSDLNGVRNESVDGYTGPTLPVEHRPSSRHIQQSP